MYYNRFGVGRIDDLAKPKARIARQDPTSFNRNALKPDPSRRKLKERRTVREFRVPLKEIKDQTHFRVAKAAVKGHNPHHFNKTYLKADPRIRKKERRIVPLTPAYREKLFREYNQVPSEMSQEVDEGILEAIQHFLA